MSSFNINIARVKTRLNEIFDQKIDMSDIKQDASNHYETRALAALALMMTAGLDPQQAVAHITDGYHDMGLDAIYLDTTQKKLIVIQSKWRNNGDGGISQEEMHSFVEGVKRIIEYDLSGANAKVVAKKEDIDYALTTMGYQIQVEFIHTGSVPSNEYVFRPMDALMQATNDDMSTLLVYNEILFKDVYAYLAQGQNMESIILDDVILSNWGKIDAPYPVYYGTISAAAVGEWYRNEGNALFEKNIRFYKGSTDVNEGIRRTLLNEPEKFFYYNNGIKLLCKKIYRKAKDSTTTATGLFRLEGVSLVNGAQTAGTIGSVFAENVEQVAKASLMIQIVDLSAAEDETYVQITKLSNTQNRIENKDFAALDPQQERIRQELLFSHYTYLYKSGDRLTNMDNQITFDEAIVAQACLHEDLAYATLAKRNLGALSEDITRTPYKALINPATNTFLLLNGALAVREIEKELQQVKERTIGRDRLTSIHGNRFVSYCVLQKIKSVDGFSTKVFSREDIAAIAKSSLEVLFPKIVLAMNELFSDSYPANIFKNATKCREIYRKTCELMAEDSTREIDPTLTPA